VWLNGDARSPFAFSKAHREASLHIEGQMLTAKGKYALKALVHLAKLRHGRTTRTIDIAQSCNIPESFLATILIDLRKLGFIHTYKGPRGGHMLAGHSNEIKIGDVLRGLEGPLAPLACGSRTAYRACPDCIDPDRCTVRAVMTRVGDAISETLDSFTLADLAASNMAPSRRRRTKIHG
jgi:Rrf2 family protein